MMETFPSLVFPASIFAGSPCMSWVMSSVWIMRIWSRPSWHQTIGQLDRLQADDIDGANALYSGLDNCEIKTMAFGGQADALEASDCTVAELTVGGDDTSFIDVYRLSLDSLTTVELQMSSPSLDSVLLLANSNFDYVNFDNKLSGSCDSSLSTLLPAGEYYVLANTYVEPVREDCGNTGGYELLASFSSGALQPLGSTLSALGSATEALFRGRHYCQ